MSTGSTNQVHHIIWHLQSRITPWAIDSDIVLCFPLSLRKRYIPIRPDNHRLGRVRHELVLILLNQSGGLWGADDAQELEGVSLVAERHDCHRVPVDRSRGVDEGRITPKVVPSVDGRKVDTGERLDERNVYVVIVVFVLGEVE